MASLKSNGTEVVRYRLTINDPHFPAVLEFSLRSNGWVLKKTKYTTGGWSGWIRAGKFVTTEPERRPEAVRAWLSRGPAGLRLVEEVS